MTLRCSSPRHIGERSLAPESFGRDSSQPSGHTSSCLACRRLIARETRQRQKGPRVGTGEFCAEPGCANRPYYQGERCGKHGGRKRPNVSEGGGETWHDVAISLLVRR